MDFCGHTRICKYEKCDSQNSAIRTLNYKTINRYWKDIMSKVRFKNKTILTKS